MHIGLGGGYCTLLDVAHVKLWCVQDVARVMMRAADVGARACQRYFRLYL